MMRFMKIAKQTFTHLMPNLVASQTVACALDLWSCERNEAKLRR